MNARPDDLPQAPISLGEVLTSSASILMRRGFFFLGSALLPVVASSLFCVCGAGCVGVLVSAVDGARSGETGSAVGIAVGAIAMILWGALSIVPLGMQMHAVSEQLAGRHASLIESLRAVRPLLLSFVPVSIAYGAAYLIGLGMCLVPAVVVAGFFSFAPVVTITEEADPETAFTRTLTLSRAAGGVVFGTAAIHALLQAVAYGVLGLVVFAIADTEHFVPVLVVAEVIYGIVAWVLFTYFAIVVPVVLHARIAGPRMAGVSGLEEVFR